MWFSCLFIKKKAVIALTSRISVRAKSSRNCKEKGVLTAYCKEVKYTLKPYTADNMIVWTDEEIIWFILTLNKTPTKYAEPLWATALCFHRKYEEYEVECSFIEGFQESINQSICSFWGSNNHTAVKDLVCSRTSLVNLQSDSKSVDGLCNGGKQATCRDKIQSRTATTMIVEPDEAPKPSSAPHQ